MSLIYAPWTDEQVAALNRWQACGHVHPFTCLDHSDTALVAEETGWYCHVSGCNYTQNWAHDFMFQPPRKLPWGKQ